MVDGAPVTGVHGTRHLSKWSSVVGRPPVSQHSRAFWALAVFGFFSPALAFAILGQEVATKQNLEFDRAILSSLRSSPEASESVDRVVDFGTNAMIVLVAIALLFFLWQRRLW